MLILVLKVQEKIMIIYTFLIEYVLSSSLDKKWYYDEILNLNLNYILYDRYIDKKYMNFYKKLGIKFINNNKNISILNL